MPPFLARIASGNGLIFIPLENGDVAALDAKSGQVKWQRTIRSDRKLRTLAVAVWKDVVLIGTEHLADLPTRDRALLAWQAETGKDAWSWPTTGDGLSIPLVHQDVAYFTSSEPRLYALDLNTRQLRWSVPALTWSPESPAIFEQIMVVPSRGSAVAAYSLDFGKRMWTFEADERETEWLHQRPIVSGDTAYLAGWGKQLYAVDLSTGRLRWRFQAERGITCPPVLAGDKLLVGVKDYRPAEGERKAGYGLYAVDLARGEPVWKFRADKHVYVAPAVADDVILVGADDRRLRALDSRDGHELWQSLLPEKLRAGPHVIGDQVIVGQRDGTIVCLQWKVEPPTRPDPQVLLAQGKPLEAATELALAGQYEAAAHLFAEHDQPQQAAALYLEADQLGEAAAIYVQSRDLDAALELYRQAGDRRGEAAVLALQGKHAEAADMYEVSGELDMAVPEYIVAGRAGHAAQLLHKAGRRKEAADLLRSVNQDDQAAEYLVEDGRYAEAAEIYQRMGKVQVAAGVLAQGGLLAEAAAINEEIGHLESAAELYIRAEQTDRALTLYEKLENWKRVAELAEVTGDLPRMANALTQSGQTARAAQVYEQAGLLDRALELYESLAQWDKVEPIARQTQQWERQAYALSQIGLASQACEAYQRAAEQLEARAPEASEALARLYEAATLCYDEDEDARRRQECWDKVCQYRQWPNLRGRFEFGAQFYQGEYNQVNLVVRNVGYGVARNIMVKKISTKFQLDTTESETSTVTRLALQQDKTIPLSLQPKPGVLGRVMLRVTLGYQDKTGRESQQEFIQNVEVLGRDEKIAAIRQQTPPGGITPPQAIYTPEEKAAKGDVDLVKLRDGLAAHFNESELRDLCFELDVDYEDLPGEGKTAKARELVAYHERRGLIPKLAAVCRRLRSNVQW
jgi:outer membrane protein assembly factor BamB